MIAETLALTVGPAIAKAILKLWLKDQSVAEAAATSLVDLLATKTKDTFAKQSGKREFEAIGEQVAQGLLHLFEMESVNIDDGGKVAVAEALASTIEKAGISAPLLVKQKLDPKELYDHLKNTVPDATRDFSEAETILYDRILFDASQYIVDIASHLPAFTEHSIAEILRSNNQLLTIAMDILAEVRQIREQSERENSQEQAARFETQYLREVVRKLDNMELFGAEISTVSRQHNLSLAYMTLNVEKKQTTKDKPVKIPDFPIDVEAEALLHDRKDTVSMSVETVIGETKHLLLTGEAGSGKTTLLKWIAVRAATQSFKDRLGSWNKKIPFYIRLREYREGNFPALDELPNLIASMTLDEMPKGWVREQFDNKRVLLLIDGVDEVKEEYRSRLQDWLGYFITTYSDIPLILTSRPLAIKGDWLKTDSYEQAKLLEMELPDIKLFIDHWHEAIRQSLQTEDEKKQLAPLAENLKAAVMDERSLRNLAASPLLCAMLCALHRDKREKLPKDRIELYDQCCQMLIEKRDLEQHIDLSAYPNISLRQKRVLLADLAYYLIRNGWSEVTQSEAEDQLDGKLSGMQQIPTGTTGAAVLCYFLERSGMVREPSSEQLSFTHRTFQEFLAASAALDVNDVGLLLKSASDDQWREVIILAAGLANQGQRRKLINGLIKKGDKLEKEDSEQREEDEILRYRFHLLALACLETSTELDEATLKALNDRLAKIMPPRNSEQAKLIAKAGELAVPHLRDWSSEEPKIQAACIEALCQIGTEEALKAVGIYIKRHSNISELKLSGSAVSDISVLAGLTQLDTLDLNGTGVSDISVLAGLTQLDTLNLNGTGVRDISVLARLTKLRSLILAGTAVSDISVLAGLTKLEILSFDNTAVSDISALARLTKLESLVLTGTAVSDISVLAGLTKLEHLLLNNTAVSDISVLAGLTNLEILWLDNTAVSDISVLPALTKLQFLFLHGTAVSDEEKRNLRNSLPNMAGI